MSWTTLNSSTNLSLTSLNDLVKFIRASPIAQLVKNPPAMQKTPVQFLGQEDPLEKDMASDSSILAWRIPWVEEPGGLLSGG